MQVGDNEHFISVIEYIDAYHLDLIPHNSIEHKGNVDKRMENRTDTLFCNYLEIS